MLPVSSFKIRQAVKKIKAGEVIAYPTEAVFGLGCDPLNEEAVLNLLALKQRAADKGLILIAASLAQLEPYLQLNSTIRAQVQVTWPGPVTWLIPSQPWVPKWLTGKHSTLAVRVTSHPIAHLLCKENGAPLVSTSANIQAKPPAIKSWSVPNSLKSQKIFILAGEVGHLKQATPIYDVMTQQQMR